MILSRCYNKSSKFIDIRLEMYHEKNLCLYFSHHYKYTDYNFHDGPSVGSFHVPLKVILTANIKKILHWRLTKRVLFDHLKKLSEIKNNYSWRPHRFHKSTTFLQMSQKTKTSEISEETHFNSKKWKKVRKWLILIDNKLDRVLVINYFQFQFKVYIQKLHEEWHISTFYQAQSRWSTTQYSFNV